MGAAKGERHPDIPDVMATTAPASVIAILDATRLGSEVNLNEFETSLNAEPKVVAMSEEKLAREKALLKKRIAAYRRQFDRIALGKRLAEREGVSLISVLAELEGTKSNRTKRAIKQMRDALVFEKLQWSKSSNCVSVARFGVPFGVLKLTSELEAFGAECRKLVISHDHQHLMPCRNPFIRILRWQSLKLPKTLNEGNAVLNCLVGEEHAVERVPRISVGW